MMLRPRWRNQSTLLERYLGALGASRRIQPPAELDPGLAELADYLHTTRQRLQPPAAFVDTLRRDLEASATDAEPLDHSWRGPTIDRRRPAPSSTPDNGEPGTEDAIMSHTTDTSGDAPLPLPGRLAHEWLKIAAAVLAFLVVGSLLVLVLRNEPNDDKVAAPVATPTQTVAPSPAPTQADIQPTATSTTAEPTATTPAPTETLSPTPAVTLPIVEPAITTIPFSQPWTMATGAGSVWVTSSESGTVSRIDPATNTVVATIDVAADGNRSADSIVADDTSVWVVAGILNLVLIDPATNQVVSTTPIDEPVDQLALGNGVLWVISSDSNLIRRFDPATNTFTLSIEIDRPQSATITDDAVWVIRDVGRGTDSEVLKIDPATGEVMTTVPLNHYFATELILVGDSLWAPTESALLQLDTGTGQIVATYPLPQPVRGVPLVATGDGSLWACGCANESEDILWQFDIDTLEWSAQIPAGNLVWRGWIVYLDRAVWSYTDQNEILRIQLPG
jgi:YVTN family beta-propeller protein